MKTLKTPLLVFLLFLLSNLFTHAAVENTGDPIKIIRNKHALFLFTQSKITFDLNSVKLNSSSIHELSKIAASLMANPNVKIQINVHNDTKSKIEISKEITQKRAELIKSFFINYGVNTANLIAIGHGDEKILNKCKDFVKCTDAEHAVNRRVELKILNPEGIDNYVMVKKPKKTVASR